MALSPNEMREKIKAVVIVQATPLNRDGGLDLDGLKANTEFLLERGKGKRIVLVPTGSTGEAYALSDQDRLRVIETVVNTVSGRVPVVAGTAKAGTELTIALSQAAENVGVDGVQVVLPYYHVPSQEGLYRHFKTIADAVDIPIILYNIPGRTNVNMSVATMARLAESCRNIVAMKDAAGDVGLTSETIGATKLAVLSGDDGLVVPMMSVGAVGVISVASNIIPKEMREMVDAALANDFARAREIHQRCFQLFKALFVETNPIGVKTAMELLRRDTGEMRLPLCEASSANRLVIRQALINAGLMGEGRA